MSTPEELGRLLRLLAGEPEADGEGVGLVESVDHRMCQLERENGLLRWLARDACVAALERCRRCPGRREPELCRLCDVPGLRGRANRLGIEVPS